MKQSLRLLAFLLAVVPLSLLGQQATEIQPGRCPEVEEFQRADLGSIAGVVLIDKDSLPGATVTVSRGKLTKTAITDVEGRYEVRNLPPGVYRVDAKLAGLRNPKRRSLIIDAGKTVAADFAMKVDPQEAIILICPGLEYPPKPGTTVITREMMDYLPVH